MPALADFEPLLAETVDTIRARIDTNVNAGLDTTDVRWQDTVPGGFFYDHTQAFALELEGVYDYVSLELPASFFLPFSWGIYLDYWGEMLGVARNPAAYARGTVTLTNTTAADVPAGAGLEVAVPTTDPDADPLVFASDASVVVPANGSVGVAITAEQSGSEYNVASHAVSLITSPVSGLTVDNAAPITEGADEELDEPYKARLLLEFTGTRGGGTIDDYIAETLEEFPQVGNVVVEPTWQGPNTVRLIISDHFNEPVTDDTRTAVQTYWDSQSPIDATVTVATVVAETVAVAATIVTAPGYSLDGAGGSTPIRAVLDQALSDYFASLTAGQAVQHNRVLAALLPPSVEGVYDVQNLTLDDGSGPVAGDVTVAELSSAQLAGPGTYAETPEV